MAKKHAVHPQPKEASSELGKECQAILDLLTEEEDEHWQIGVHYNRIVDGRLAQAEGFKSAKEFFTQRLTAISQSTLSLYGAIAKTFSEDSCRRQTYYCSISEESGPGRRWEPDHHARATG